MDDKEMVERAALFVRDELDGYASWFAAAWVDIYRRLEELEAKDRQSLREGTDG